MEVRTVPEILNHARGTHRKVDAFLVKRAEGWRSASIEEVIAWVDRVAALLRRRGVAKGDRVAILSESRIEWAVADMAILSLGAVCVPIYATLPAGQVAPLLVDSGCGGVFVSGAEQRRKIESIRAEVPFLRWVHCFDGEPIMGGERPTGEGVDAGCGSEPTVGPDDLATILYTSGTTGVPKGVMLTHGNIASQVRLALHGLPLEPTDTYLSFLPLSHVFERCSGLYTMLYAGTTIAYAESLEQVPQNLREVRPTIILGVPRFYEKLVLRAMEAASAGGARKESIFRWAHQVAIEWAKRRDARTSVPAGLSLKRAIANALVYKKLAARLGGRVRLLVSGGAPLNPEVALFFNGAGLPVREGYGLSETSSAVAVNTQERHRIGTVGPMLPGIDARIAEDGEILLRGPVVMNGYWNRPDETAAALKNGWFHTGDIGEIDADGFLRITDRKKDVIVTSGGKKVAPQPLEAALKASPRIAEAIVVGEGRKYIGALIVAASGVTSEQVAEEVERVNATLAQFEKIKRFELIPDDLTVENGLLTPSLKVKRKPVLERHRDLLERLFRADTSGAA